MNIEDIAIAAALIFGGASFFAAVASMGVEWGAGVGALVGLILFVARQMSNGMKR